MGLEPSSVEKSSPPQCEKSALGSGARTKVNAVRVVVSGKKRRKAEMW
jgi:hypothetical protein